MVTAAELTSGPDVMDKIMDIVAAEAMIDRKTFAPETLLEELNIQSADYVMILMAIEEEFGIYISVDSELTDAKTVGDLMRIVAQKIKVASGGETV